MPPEAQPTGSAPPKPAELFDGLDPACVRYADDRARRRLTPVLTRWAERDNAGQWRRVKHSASRTIYRFAPSDGQGVLYLKHFHNLSILHRLQRRLGTSDAPCEMRFSKYLSGRDVPVQTVLATCHHNGTEWLISEAVEPAVPADRWHAEQLAAGHHGAIRAATVALAELVGRMHAGGVIHRDLHCGNVLVRTDSPARLVLMDLHRMARRRRRVRRAANLAQLLHDRLLWTTRSQRLRFLKHYLRASETSGSLRGWVRLVEPMGRRHHRRQNAHRDRRIFGTNRYFARLKIGGWRAHVVLDSKRQIPGSAATGSVFCAEAWRAVLADPDALFVGPDVEVVKDSASGYIVRRRLQVGDQTVDAYIKRPRRKRPIRWLTDLFRLSRPLRAFRMGHALLGRHIYTALPLAAMEKRRGRFLVDSILITEAVGSALHLNRFLNRYFGSSAEAGELDARARHRLGREVLWQLGRLVRRLNEEGFAHRDLKATNLLVYGDPRRRRRPDLIMVDLDGVRRVRHVSERERFRGLMRLNVSLLECPVVNRAGRLRMLLGYLRRPGAGRINFRPAWSVLARWSERKIRRQIASRQKRQKAQRRNRS